jgi:hypothetical protein
VAGVRIRWRGVARVAAILVVGLLALRLLPGFLRAPEPPPLGADVGLPKATPAIEVPAPDGQRRRSRPQKSRPRPVEDAAASRAVIGSKRQHRVSKIAKPPARPEPKLESSPPPVPEYVPPVIPEPIPPPPPAPRSTPGDGSQEFAPH